IGRWRDRLQRRTFKNASRASQQRFDSELFIGGSGISPKESKLDSSDRFKSRAQFVGSQKQLVRRQRQLACVIRLGETVFEVTIKFSRAIFDGRGLIDHKDSILEIIKGRSGQRASERQQVLPTWKGLTTLSVRQSRPEIATESLVRPITFSSLRP